MLKQRARTGRAIGSGAPFCHLETVRHAMVPAAVPQGGRGTSLIVLTGPRAKDGPASSSQAEDDECDGADRGNGKHAARQQ